MAVFMCMKNRIFIVFGGNGMLWPIRQHRRWIWNLSFSFVFLKFLQFHSFLITCTFHNLFLNIFFYFIKKKGWQTLYFGMKLHIQLFLSLLWKLTKMQVSTSKNVHSRYMHLNSMSTKHVLRGKIFVWFDDDLFI